MGRPLKLRGEKGISVETKDQCWNQLSKEIDGQTTFFEVFEKTYLTQQKEIDHLHDYLNQVLDVLERYNDFIAEKEFPERKYPRFS